MSGIACAKLILFGEHSAVSGYPAIGLPLPLMMKVTLSSSESAIGELIPHLTRLIPELQQDSPYRLEIQSEIPTGVGLGSSSALCVATVRAAYEYIGEEIEPKKLWKIAHEIEKQYHGKPSGIDTGISAYESLVYFEKKEEELPSHKILERASLHLVIGALPRANNTEELIEQVQSHERKQEIFEALGNLTMNAVEKINDPGFIGECANEAQALLSQFALSTPELDQILKFGNSCGAFGGKLSGAGGGGAYFLVAGNQEHAEEIARALSNHIIDQKIPSALRPMPFQFQRKAALR